MRSFLGHMSLNWQFIVDVSEERTASVLKIKCCFTYFEGVCVLCWLLRHAVAHVVEVLHYKTEIAGSIPEGVLPAALLNWSRLSL